MSQAQDNSNDPLHAKKKAWSGRFSEPVDAFVLRYTASVDFDKRMALVDIDGSVAHATMLAKVGVISEQDLADIKRGMAQIREEIQTGKFEWQLELEDVHLNIEARLTALIGDAGKRLHTGRFKGLAGKPSHFFVELPALPRGADAGIDNQYGFHGVPHSIKLVLRARQSSGDSHSRKVLSFISAAA